jgi:hypothetical protein
MLGIDSRNHERLQASFNGRKSRISTAEPVILIVLRLADSFILIRFLLGGATAVLFVVNYDKSRGPTDNKGIKTG